MDCKALESKILYRCKETMSGSLCRLFRYVIIRACSGADLLAYAESASRCMCVIQLKCVLWKHRWIIRSSSANNPASVFNSHSCELRIVTWQLYVCTDWQLSNSLCTELHIHMPAALRANTNRFAHEIPKVCSLCRLKCALPAHP